MLKLSRGRIVAAGNHFFDNPTPTVDIALFNDKGEVLIAERAVEPNKGRYDLPGGFLEIGESIEEGLFREVAEELSLQPEDFTNPIFIGSYPSNYRFSKESRPILIFVFAAKLKTSKTLIPLDDVASTRFVGLNELGSVDFSLPDYHPVIIPKAHNKLLGA